MERIQHYSCTAGEDRPREEPRRSEDPRGSEQSGEGGPEGTGRPGVPVAPPPGWPEHGRVTFVDVSLRYRWRWDVAGL